MKSFKINIKEYFVIYTMFTPKEIFQKYINFKIFINKALYNKYVIYNYSFADEGLM